MITKNDALVLLADLKSTGVDTTDMVTALLSSDDIPVEVLKFINSNRSLDLTEFYKKLRKSYNEKHSKLYISILKPSDNIEDIITTLASLNLQILLFSKTLTDKKMFLKQSRALEISLVLAQYFKSYDTKNVIRLLNLIKADLIAIEYIDGKRSLRDTI